MTELVGKVVQKWSSKEPSKFVSIVVFKFTLLVFMNFFFLQTGILQHVKVEVTSNHNMLILVNVFHCDIEKGIKLLNRCIWHNVYICHFDNSFVNFKLANNFFIPVSCVALNFFEQYVFSITCNNAMIYTKTKRYLF